MRKIIVLSFITLDGVMQAPGGPGEDTSGNFEFGGWTAPYTDDISTKVMTKQMEPADLLIGRKTFEIFACYWPKHAHFWPGINDVTKYVLSNTVEKSDWSHSVFIKSLDDIKNLKASNGPDLKVWGSSMLVKLLLTNNLVDELWLKIYPLILGNGKKLFDDSAVPAAFIVTDSVVTPSGILAVTYKRSGDVTTGQLGPA